MSQDTILPVTQQSQCADLVQTEETEKFICFLRHCAERLNKGDTVEEIWREYQHSTAW